MYTEVGNTEINLAFYYDCVLVTSKIKIERHLRFKFKFDNIIISRTFIFKYPAKFIQFPDFVFHA